MYTFFLVVHAIIAVAMVGVILMQRSEGGGLAGGGNPAGLMSARGAADFLTRTTTILATLFVVLSIALATLAITDRAPKELDTSLARKPVQAPAVPTSAVPMAGVPTLPASAGDSTSATPANDGGNAPAAKSDAKSEPAKTERTATKERNQSPTPAKKDEAPKAEAPAAPAPAPADSGTAEPK